MSTVRLHHPHPHSSAPLAANSSPRPSQPLRRWRAIALRVREVLATWRERARSRRDLRTALQLYDSMGVPIWNDLARSRGELSWEADKPFWRA